MKAIAPMRHLHTIPITLCLWRRDNPIGDLRLHLRNHRQQIIDNLISRFAPRVLDGLHLLLCVLAGILLGFLVAACVLRVVHQSQPSPAHLQV